MPRRASALALPAAWAAPALRYLASTFEVLVVFGIVLLVAGKDPLRAYADTLRFTFGNAYGFSELLVRVIPLLLTAAAVALPARLGLINVGGEGQLYIGAVFATGVALGFSELPAWQLAPLTVAGGFAGGALWAAVPGLLRAWGLVNETISTLLLNYVAPQIVAILIFGPWRSAESSAYPQSPAFVDAAKLPAFFNTRVHAGLLLALAALLCYWLLIDHTRWGLDMRAVGGNPEASRRLGVPNSRYIVLAMALGGGVAGLAGMGEASAIQGRLVAGLSPGYGYVGFMISWLAGGNAIGIVVMAFVFALITSAGDILQISQGVPHAVVNILMAMILFVVLGRTTKGGKR